MESEAEAKRMTERRLNRDSKNAEKGGEALIDLAIEANEPGLGGRSLITLVKRNRGLDLPWNRLRVGSPVLVSKFKNDDGESWSGVVSKRRRDSIQVSTNRLPDGDSFRLDLSADEITRKRSLAAIQLARQSRGRLGHIRRILMGEVEPKFGKLPEIEFSAAATNDHLNQSQRQAIEFALSAEDIAIIHGPPGTGKTTTVVELIIQAVNRGEKILACAPSNTAVDNLLSKLHTRQQRVVRLGHPARVAKGVQGRTLDALVADHENMRIAKDMLRESEDLYRQIDRHTRARPAPGARREMRQEAKRLKNDARLLERQAISHILDRADIVCATTTLDDSLLGDRWFDLVVIDEACQSTEPGCWIPICRCDKVVFAGDHCQLPPTILSKEAVGQGFDLSLMERQVELHGESGVKMLDVQYRMHNQIMKFSSDQFYEGNLNSDSSVATHTLSELSNVRSDESTEKPVTFFDTAGAGWNEELEPEGSSRRNRSEADFVLTQSESLKWLGLPLNEMAIIAPYAAQVRLIRDLATSLFGTDHLLEIDTVDGFQGREKEAILISFVRSNDRGEIGFLGDARRMNVALTRARRKLIVVGDSATIAGHPFYDSLLEYFDSIGAYRSIWQVF